MKITKKNLKRGAFAGASVLLCLTLLLTGTAAKSGGAASSVRTVNVARSDVNKTVSVSGVVKSNNSVNIYSTLAYQIKKINVDVGDVVHAGDVLAELDTDNVNFDLRTAETSFKSAQNGVTNEQRTIADAITNAEANYEKAQLGPANAALTLQKAELDLAAKQTAYELALKDDTKFKADGVSAKDNIKYSEADLTGNSSAVVSDAYLAMKYAYTDLNDALTDYNEAYYDFNDYAYQKAITDAKNAWERAEKGLQEARDDLAKASDDAFDDDKLKLAVTNAQAAYDNAKKAEERAEYDYTVYMVDVRNNSVAYDRDTITALENRKADATDARQNAEVSLKSAQHALDQGYTDYDDGKDSAVTNAKRAVDKAQNSLTDAVAAYDKATKDLDKARTDEVKKYKTAYDKAKEAYERAVRAYESAKDGNKQSLQNAADALAAAKVALEQAKMGVVTANTDLKTASTALAQARAKMPSQDAESAEINLEKVNKNIVDSNIVATSDGVITENNVKVGQNPSGVMFVIEDTKDLCVSAKVREYSVVEMEVGESATLTTEATSDQTFTGSIIYISPKAVSADGDTTVEFEVKAKIDNPTDNVRIGMNAFINTITKQSKNVLNVPIMAVGEKDGGNYILKVNEDGTTQEIPVTVGLKTATAIEISGDGISEGMAVATDHDAVTGNVTVSNAGGGGFGGPRMGG